MEQNNDNDNGSPRLEVLLRLSQATPCVKTVPEGDRRLSIQAGPTGKGSLFPAWGSG